MQHRQNCRRHSLIRFAILALGLIGGMATTARAQAPLPERLLTPADIEKVGLKGTVRPSVEMYDPADGLHFVRETDSALVLTVAAPGGGGNLKETVHLLASDAAPVGGVGDEAYAGLGGSMLMFRKGNRTIQLLAGMDAAGGGKIFLTPAQMLELAKVIASRL